ncbi:MAG: hypothetical protein QMB64_03845 [Pseudomonadales bacterium]
MQYVEVKGNGLGECCKARFDSVTFVAVVTVVAKVTALHYANSPTQ